MSEEDSPQIKLVHEWGEAWGRRDLDFIAKIMHKDYRHTIYSRSVGRQDQNREEWPESLTGFSKLWAERELTIHSITDSPGKVILHMTNKIKTPFGIDATIESISISHVVTDDDGS